MAEHIWNWEELSAKEDWETLVLGNGASINIWGRFNYTSLYEVALNSGTLSADVVRIFTEYDTTNFELCVPGCAPTCPGGIRGPQRGRE